MLNNGALLGTVTAAGLTFGTFLTVNIPINITGIGNYTLNVVANPSYTIAETLYDDDYVQVCNLIKLIVAC